MATDSETIKALLDIVSPYKDSKLPIIVKTWRGLRILGWADSHREASAVASVQYILHGAISRAKITGEERMFFFVRS